jgi:hypothetical protein
MCKQFNVWTVAVLRGLPTDPLKTYAVTVDGEVGRVEVPLARSSLVSALLTSGTTSG